MYTIFTWLTLEDGFCILQEFMYVEDKKTLITKISQTILIIILLKSGLQLISILKQVLAEGVSLGRF